MKTKMVAIQLNYKGEIYLGEFKKSNEEEEFSAKKLLSYAAKGELKYLSIECKDGIYYFSEQILKESILGLVYKTD